MAHPACIRLLAAFITPDTVHTLLHAACNVKEHFSVNGLDCFCTLGNVTAARCRACFVCCLLLHMHAGRSHTYIQAALCTDLDDSLLPNNLHAEGDM